MTSLGRCLVLDAERQPLGLVCAEDAICSLLEGSAQPILNDPERMIRSPSRQIALPLIIARDTLPSQWSADQAGPRERLPISQRVLAARDEYRCGYCRCSLPHRSGWTIDHVRPACLFPSRPVATYWENIALACRPCNARKADQTPDRFGWPATRLRPPHPLQQLLAGRLNRPQLAWLASNWSGRSPLPTLAPGGSA